VLNEAAARILRLLRHEAMEPQQLRDQLLQMFEPEDKELFVEHLWHHLGHLADLCLIVPEGRIEL